MEALLHFIVVLSFYFVWELPGENARMHFSTTEDSDSVDLDYLFWILTLYPYYKYHHSNCSLEADFFRNTDWGKRWGGGGHGSSDPVMIMVVVVVSGDGGDVGGGCCVGVMKWGWHNWGLCNQ